MPLTEQFIDYPCEGWLVQPNLDDRRAPLPPPRFSLAAMLTVVSLLAVLFAAMSYVGSSAMMVLVVFALAIAAHVAGNYLGTQLRDSKRVPDGPTSTADVSTAMTHRRQQPARAAARLGSAARLRQRFKLGKPAWAVTLAGVLIGGAAGGYVLTIYLQRASLESIALGAFAFAVLGGIWTFLAASFVQVALATVWQAARGSERDRQLFRYESVHPAATEDHDEHLDDPTQSWSANDYSTS